MWSCVSDLKFLGRTMQPRKIREKSLWLVMLKHQNLNRQNIQETCYYRASVIKLSNTSYFKQLKRLLAKGIRKKKKKSNRLTKKAGTKSHRETPGLIKSSQLRVRNERRDMVVGWALWVSEADRAWKTFLWVAAYCKASVCISYFLSVWLCHSLF